ncbi:RsmB/NOP family class I SAM-dependent RNA methyltransferase [Candidatus Woesearchaeota archaeon]|nr:RsmB/NOP family class I SAM-dependent RNA methyltransferase [Candidatus Woesearchaeota archaeon]
MSLLSRYHELGVEVDPSFRPRPALRVNVLRVSEVEFLRVMRRKGVVLEPIPGVPHGFWYESSFSLGATPEFLLGWYYLQEAASQVPPLVLAPVAGDCVLDMAAAPGSKTSQLAQLMSDDGVVVALDADRNRLASLRNNLERLGVSCVVSYKKDARFAHDLGLSFDKVLLDAPCSGNFCVEQDFFSKRSVADVKQRARLQKELLRSAYRVLKRGGVLVYSTCSLEPEEDEAVVDWFLKEFPDVSLSESGVSLGEPGLTSAFGRSFDQSLSLTRRFWPSRAGTQGFFVARLVKG